MFRMNPFYIDVPFSSATTKPVIKPPAFTPYESAFQRGSAIFTEVPTVFLSATHYFRYREQESKPGDFRKKKQEGGLLREYPQYKRLNRLSVFGAFR